MAQTSELTITLPGGRRVDVQVGGHVLHTDQPRAHGGEDAAPTPFQVFLASIGACAGIFVQGFCASRGLPTDGVSVVERPIYDPDGALAEVDLELRLPPGFPEKYRAPLVRAVEQCSVKRAIQRRPEFRVRVAVGPAEAGAGA